jgi:heterodisulfide reductase subunit C
MKIDMAAVMDALRILTVRKKDSAFKENVHIFNKSFLNTVRLFGRTFDLGMIAAYKVRTSSYMQDTEKFPMMLIKRKIALLPSFKSSKKYIHRIFKNLHTSRNRFFHAKRVNPLRKEQSVHPE